MFSKTYGYILKHQATRRGYWGHWYYKRRYEEVLKILSKFCKNRNITILELGCESGIYAQYLERMNCKCQYVGCDIDAKSLKSAYQGQSTTYVLCDIQRLPFREKSAQVVLCSEVLEHLSSPYRALGDICRTTTWALILSFPEERLLSSFKDRHPEHISEIDKESVVNFLISEKFKLLKISYIFRAFIPCGILEFLGIPRNTLTQTVVALIDKLLERIIPSMFVPHKTILIDARQM